MHKILTSSAQMLSMMVNRLIVLLASPWEPWVYCSTFDHSDERRIRF